ncbi:twin-arginine translocase subunit TatC [Candidatus Saccharibacteria bacterium]|nr:twin-arginine translocase subunit TatC [Candidatus Saccharibacteria bacterium]
MKRLARHSRPTTKLFDHLRELQMRTIVSVVALVISGIAVYGFYEPLLSLLRSPLGAPLYYSSPAGSFAFVMKVCFMGALTVTIPIIIYNLIMFVRPVFDEKLTLGRVYVTTTLSAVLALMGAVFGFVFIIPGTLRFFAGFQVDGLSALISADNYLSFVTNVIITFVLVFQLPLLIALIDSIKPLPPKKLLGMEKWVILGSLVISLLVPFAFDLTTSLLIALPIVVLYNLSIVIVVLQHASLARKIRVAARAAGARSVFDQSSTAESALSLSELSFESLVGELAHFEQTTPLLTTEPQQPGVDIRPLTARPQAVVSADWVHRLAEPITLDAHVRLISDISRQPRANRALA